MNSQKKDDLNRVGFAVGISIIIFICAIYCLIRIIFGDYGEQES